MNRKKKKIAICLFGIVRNSKKCIPSLYKNVIAPLKEVYDVTVYFHIYKLNKIHSYRSNENSVIDESTYDFLNEFKGILEKSTQIDENYADIIFSKGDPFHNDFRSLKNLFRQLLSLSKVYADAKKENPSSYLFLRPDLEYTDKFDVIPVQECIENTSRIVIPYWQWWDGMNDRFAICGPKAANAYANRYYMLFEFCAYQNNMMHGENLVKYLIRKYKLSLRVTDLKAYRVRVNGERVNEAFNLFLDKAQPEKQSKLTCLYKLVRIILRRIKAGNLLILLWRYLLDIKLKRIFKK